MCEIKFEHREFPLLIGINLGKKHASTHQIMIHLICLKFYFNSNMGSHLQEGNFPKCVL